MNPGIVRRVFAKELRETLRDRRTLVVMLVVPIFLYPALLIVMQQLAIFGQRQLEEAPASVLAQGADAEILARLAADERLSVATVDEPAASLVASGDAEVFVRFEAGRSSTGFSSGSPGDLIADSISDSTAIPTADSTAVSPARPDAARQVTVIFDASRDRSRIGREAVLESIDAWGDSLLDARLAARGLPRGFAEPVVVADSSVATPERMGGYALGRFLPMLLILMTLLGAFYPAIDLSAGEKERGTLETILTTPVQAADFVAGKFLTVTVVGITAAALNLMSMLLTFRLAAFQLAEGLAIELSLPWTTIVVVLLALVPLTVLFAALFLGIALRAQSFKEAQNALTPVQLASMIPIMLPVIPGLALNYALAMVPIGGLALLFREMMTGGAPAGPGLVAVGATIVYAGVALRFAATSFGREEVLFGVADKASGAPSQWLAARRRRGRKTATPGEALAFVAVVALLFFYLAPLLTVRFSQVGIMASQILLMGLPAVAFVLLGGFGAREGLGLRTPSAQQLVGGLMMAAGGLPVAWLLGWVQSFVLEIPEEFLAAFEDLIRAETPGEIAWLLLLVAVTPAVCEELVFRGVLLRGLGSRMPMISAVGTSALLFGLFHLSTETAIRLLPSAWLGLLLGYAGWRTRSLFVSMAMHFVNNASIVVLVAWPALQERVTGASGAPAWWLVPLGLGLLAMGGRVLSANHWFKGSIPADRL